MKFVKVFANLITLPVISTLAMSSAPNDVHAQPTAVIRVSPETSGSSNTISHSYGLVVEVLNNSTDYSASYSNLSVSVTIGVGSDEPVSTATSIPTAIPTSIATVTATATATATTTAVSGTGKDNCDGRLLVLLPGLGIDIGISLDLSILGLNICLGL